MSRSALRYSLLVGLFAAIALIAVMVMPAAASPSSGSSPLDEPQPSDDLSHPLGDAQRAAHQEALIAQVQGKASGKTHQVANGQYVELSREGEDLIWTTLGEFPNFPHNNIAEPDRATDNTTYWVPDFNRDHYLEMLFSEEEGANSMRNFYIEQSSNRYAVAGDVTDWVEVPWVAAEYGGSSRDAWYFVDHSVDAWYAAQLAEGKTAEEIGEYLSQFDVWDRYDYDNDGDFDEPDGYIDHYQAIHSGEGEEAGGGALGSDAIWSHRWYVQLTRVGQGGPVLEDGTQVPFGGTQIGDSRYWIGDYTTEPENGAVGVFAHEFAHDLGLPDLYDTSGGENSTGFWTLMSSGSWTTGSPDYIGTKPTHMGAWEKMNLGWLNYEVAYAGEKSEHKLGPMEANTKQAQAVVVMLPDKEVVVRGELRSYFHAYVAEFRQYWGYDDALRTGPYNFTGDNWVEHFPYQPGLLINYWDTSQRNNSVSRHPGEGLILPIDAHPEPMWRPDGEAWRNRVQTYDSTFGLEPTDAITLHYEGEASYHESRPAVPIFDDNIQYWNEEIPWTGVINPHTGTQIRVKSTSAHDSFMQVEVRPSN